VEPIEYSAAAERASTVIMAVILLGVLVLAVFSKWKILEKAGEHGWAGLIPFYGTYLFYKISTGKGWLIVFQIIPMINIIFTCYMLVRLSRAFRQSTGFAFGLIFLPLIFLMVLAFDKSITYVGSKGLYPEPIEFGFCHQCGERILVGMESCPYCGQRQIIDNR
jgi:hypothetical protein